MATGTGQVGRAKGRFGSWWIAAPGIVLILAMAVGVIVWRMRPRLTDDVVDGLVTAAIQQEAKQAFLVTGYLQLTSTARIDNTLRLLPGLLNLPVGTTTVSVRVPGRVHYGFDADMITPDRIRLMPDGIIEVIVPEPKVYTVSPDLSAMEIETAVGWTRLADDSREEVQARALALVQQNMQQQAEQHLRTSEQPELNTAAALYRMLRPVFIAAGISDPVFRFRIGSDIIVQPQFQ